MHTRNTGLMLAFCSNDMEDRRSLRSKRNNDGVREAHRHQPKVLSYSDLSHKTSHRSSDSDTGHRMASLQILVGT
ncbi:vacuolar protein sorting-associated protein 70 [Moniliophthora roreri]|nr:vacuolar protein sorting-associated protein 70 [Moniliophthora roreri]